MRCSGTSPEPAAAHLSPPPRSGMDRRSPRQHGQRTAERGEHPDRREGSPILAPAVVDVGELRAGTILNGRYRLEGPLALGPDRADLRTRSFKDIAPALRDWAAERVTLHPRNCFYAPVRLDSFWTETWDADVIYCLQAPNPGRRHLERCAEKLGARWHEIDTGHYPMLTTPVELARLLMAR